MNTGITPPPPKYREGDEIRQNGRVYRRIDGNWVAVGVYEEPTREA